MMDLIEFCEHIQNGIENIKDIEVLSFNIQPYSILNIKYKARIDFNFALKGIHEQFWVQNFRFDKTFEIGADGLDEIDDKYFNEAMLVIERYVLNVVEKHRKYMGE